MTSALVFAPLAIIIPIVALGLPVLVCLFKGYRLEEISPEWLDNFSASSYYPMQDLLSDEDFNFLSRQPGFDASLYRKLRRDRLHIFRQYFLRMIHDFNRLHAIARALIAETTEDHSELMMKMLVLKLRFSVSVVFVEMNYWRCFIRFRPLMVQTLITRLEDMSLQLQLLASLRSNPTPSVAP